MKRYSLTYLIGESFKSFWRNGVMSFASIAVLMSCLVIIGAFSLIIMNINVNIEKLGLMNEIVVFVDYNLAEEDIASIENQIRQLDNINSIEHITKQQALNDMKENSGEYGDMYAELEGDNPLPDAFRITYSDNSKASTLYYQLAQIDGVNKVNNRLDIATAIENLKNGISIVCIGFLAILFIVSIFVIINTIKLAVIHRRTEIEIMRYIGASSWFIALPFIFEGMIIGLFASGAAYLFECLLYHYVEASISEGMQMIVTILPFSDIALNLALFFVAVGVITGIIGSNVSLSKYLKA